MKRLKMAIAALLAFALLPLIGSTALADESSASSRAEQIRAAANIETIADASTMGDWSGVVENTTQNIGRIWTDKTVSTNDIDISGAMSATVLRTIPISSRRFRCFLLRRTSRRRRPRRSTSCLCSTHRDLWTTP